MPPPQDRYKKIPSAGSVCATDRVVPALRHRPRHLEMLHGWFAQSAGVVASLGKLSCDRDSFENNHTPKGCFNALINYLIRFIF